MIRSWYLPYLSRFVCLLGLTMLCFLSPAQQTGVRTDGVYATRKIDLFGQSAHRYLRFFKNQRVSETGYTGSVRKIRRNGSLNDTLHAFCALGTFQQSADSLFYTTRHTPPQGHGWGAEKIFDCQGNLIGDVLQVTFRRRGEDSLYTPHYYFRQMDLRKVKQPISEKKIQRLQKRAARKRKRIFGE